MSDTRSNSIATTFLEKCISKNTRIPETSLESIEVIIEQFDNITTVMRRYQHLAAILGSATLPTEINDVEKAQLLLGFLASPPDEAPNHDGKENKDEQ